MDPVQQLKQLFFSDFQVIFLFESAKWLAWRDLTCIAEAS